MKSAALSIIQQLHTLDADWHLKYTSLGTCGTYVYLRVKYFKNLLKYKYLSTIAYRYLSTSTQVHEQYLSTYLSTNVLKYIIMQT